MWLVLVVVVVAVCGPQQAHRTTPHHFCFNAARPFSPLNNHRLRDDGRCWFGSTFSPVPRHFCPPKPQNNDLYKDMARWWKMQPVQLYEGQLFGCEVHGLLSFICNNMYNYIIHVLLSHVTCQWRKIMWSPQKKSLSFSSPKSGPHPNNVLGFIFFTVYSIQLWSGILVRIYVIMVTFS